MTAGKADILAQLALELAAEDDLIRMFDRVVGAAVTDVAGAEHAGITLLDSRAVSTPACSDELVRRVDEAQYHARQGPCLQAAVDRVPHIRVDDLGAETRWPRFTEQALELGVRALLSFHLYARGDNIGALNIYATAVRPFTPESVHMGSLLAAHAAVGVAATRKELSLRTALESRDTIGQAKGILMERFKLNSQDAFDLLVAVSQHTHRKLRDIAEELAVTGQLRDLA